MIILRGVNVFPSEIQRVLLQIEGLIPNYQIHRLQKGTMESVVLHVETTDALYEEIAVGGSRSCKNSEVRKNDCEIDFI